ncbi:GNAT family N-acetyltransferase [Flexivirga caeni]|uniref:GNAT family N-acetyltransferase n=1 Tax=Flexivirga caeni TaxID=2294115 RepID=A0A3M9MCE2_9MICO|nr:GNAT family N-acetyltransferase [Flexivirga caeni]RNI23194.1 GNAT family N-acetyltransferase [Flexivirga caeni]
MPVFPDDVPVLSDGVVRLRAHTEPDVPAIVRNCQDGESARWLHNLPQPYGEAEAYGFLAAVADQWAQGSVRTWAVEAGGRYAGSVSLHRRSAAAFEVGYNGHPDTRGNGYLSAAARLVVQHAFGDLGARTVIWRAGRGNWASRRVAWKLGMTVDGSWPDSATNGLGQTQDLWFGHVCRDGWTGAPAHPWHQPEVLEGNGIRLRPWTDMDVPDEPLDEDLTRFMLGTAPATDDFADWLLVKRERMADGEAICWCIADAATDRALGGIQLHRMNVPMLAGSAMLAYWLQPSVRGAGRVSTALDLVVAHAFSPTDQGGLGLRRIGANVDVENLASQRVLRESGFRAIGTVTGLPVYDDGSWSDETEFELLATDDRDAQRARAIPLPTLRTERLVLRAWGEGDAPGQEPAPDAQGAAAMGIEPRPPAAAYDHWLARSRLDDLKGTAVTWCIADAMTGRPLGSVSIRGLGGPRRSGTVGYWLYDAARGHGYTSEALKAVVDHAFSPEGLDLFRLDAATVGGNHASMLTLATAGFRQYGQDHGSFVTADGSVTDSAYFELLASEHQDRAADA